VTNDPSWTDVFGHPTPYPEQVDGIEAAIDAAEEGGFLALEGACGTGKTMLSLTAGIDRVRDPDSAFERVFVLTSVKQQLRQFESDLETINANLPARADPVSGVTLVGKADVCPYARESRAGIDRGTVYERCDGLRERTRNLIGDDGTTTAGALSRAARSRQVGLADSGRGSTDTSSDFLAVDGEPTPYPPETETHGDTEFCPFYAGYLEDLPEDGEGPEAAVPFEYETRGHVGPDELVRLAASHGSCPHSVMGALVPAVEVVIGNYYHAFDPVTTTTFTGALLDESTFVVCDEAHMLEPRVRDLVSDRVADASLRDAVTELTRVIQPLTLSTDSSDPGDDSATTGTDRTETAAGADAETIRAELADADVTLEDLERVRAFYADLRDELDRRVTAHLDATRPDWRASGSDETDRDVPLRDPTEPGRDEIARGVRRPGVDVCAGGRRRRRARARCDRGHGRTLHRAGSRSDDRRVAPRGPHDVLPGDPSRGRSRRDGSGGLVATDPRRESRAVQLPPERGDRRPTRRVRRRRADERDARADGRLPRGDRPRPPRGPGPTRRRTDARTAVSSREPGEFRGRRTEVHPRQSRGAR